MTRTSGDDGRHGSLLRKATLAAGSLLLGGTVTLGAAAGAAAQATPATADCVAPAAAPMAAAMASPAAAAVATPGDAALGDAAAQAAANVVACWNAGNLDAFTALVTPNFLMQQFGAKDAAAAKTQLGEMGPAPQIAIVGTSNPATYDDGRASLDVIYTFGTYQYTNARWVMVKDGDQLLLDSEQPLRPQPWGDTSIISFTAADDATAAAFDQRSELPANEVLILHGTNNGTKARNLALLKMPEGTATPPADMAGVEVVGTLVIEPGQAADMALVNLPAGDYVLADQATGATVPLKVTVPSE